MKLNPCPICGGKLEFVYESCGTTMNRQRCFHKSYRIRCLNCGATRQKSVSVYLDYDPIVGVILNESELETEVAFWNQETEDDT